MFGSKLIFDVFVLFKTLPEQHVYLPFWHIEIDSELEELLHWNCFFKTWSDKLHYYYLQYSNSHSSPHSFILGIWFKRASVQKSSVLVRVSKLYVEIFTCTSVSPFQTVFFWFFQNEEFIYYVLEKRTSNKIDQIVIKKSSKSLVPLLCKELLKV